MYMTDPQQQQQQQHQQQSGHLYKILVVGDYAVGKTSLIRRYCTGEYSSSYRITIGVDFCLKTLPQPSSASSFSSPSGSNGGSGDVDKNVSLQLWDIAGHERFGAMTRVYYRFAIAAVVCFDISRPSTLDNVKKWRDDINDKVMLPDGSPIPMILLATKSDLPDISIDHEKMNRFARDNGFIGWFSTSARENTGIDEAFDYLVERIVKITNRLSSAGTPANTQPNGGNGSNASMDNKGIRVLVDNDKTPTAKGGGNRRYQEIVGRNQYRNRQQVEETRSGCCG